ncbi:methyltransferase [Myxococcota bacterium]|nr:methyltransferase [Myxococcota bacterium]
MNPTKPSNKPPPQPSPPPAAAAVAAAEPSRCRHHPRCPGCPLMGRDYAEQLQTKHARVRRAFARFGHLPVPQAPLPAPRQMAYRHRLKLPLHITNDHVSIGLYDRAGRTVLDTPDCPVLDAGLRESLQPVLAWLRGKRGVHSLDLRRSEATGELQAVFACKGGELPGGARAARALAQAVPKLRSIAVSRADPEGRRVIGDAPRVIAGRAHIEEAIGATRYRIYPGAFFQVDPASAVGLHKLVKDGLGGARRVLDLYAGVGAYALMLAGSVEKVVAIEEVPAAVEAARAMAPRNVEVIGSKVEDQNLEGRFDAAVLNPARRGADPKTLERLARAVQRLVYVSCGPETLARDLDILAAFGMRARSVVPLDLFPQTPEIETVVVLERGPAVKDWAVKGGRAQGPWFGEPSGAIGKPLKVWALVVGEVNERLRVPRARFKRLAVIATHSLVELRLEGPLQGALGALARAGHPIAGEHAPTRRFFAERAGLVRPFVHVAVADRAFAPLHGDLALALEALDAPAKLIQSMCEDLNPEPGR